MKKAIKISLGGLAFNIEEDAYAILDSYLESLNAHLGSTPEAQEIVSDIEERASELFAEMLNGQETITLQMVESVIDTLGRPEQIASEDNDPGNENEGEGEEAKETTGRRLYRDGDKGMIGGVAAGLGAYFNVDTMVFRVIFIALLLAKGLGFLIYLILWVATPVARTTRQKMEMRGEPINLSNLEKNVKEEYKKVKENLEKQNVSGFFQKLFIAFGQVFIVLGRAFGVIFKVIGIILAVAFISASIIGLLVATLSIFHGTLFVSILPSIFGLDLTEGITLVELFRTTFDLGSVLWLLIPLYFVLAIPLLALLFLGLRMIFRFKIRDSIVFVASATTWILAVVFLAIVLFFQARSFTIREDITERIELVLEDETNSTIHLAIDPTHLEDLYHAFSIEEYSVAYMHKDKPEIVGKPIFVIGKSNSDSFELEFKKRSRGATGHLARKSARDIVLTYTFDANLLRVDPFYTLSSGEKWRAQDVTVTLLVPEGKRVFIDMNMRPFLSSDQEYSLCWPDEMVGHTWEMRGNSLREVK